MKINSKTLLFYATFQLELPLGGSVGPPGPLRGQYCKNEKVKIWILFMKGTSDENQF